MKGIGMIVNLARRMADSSLVLEPIDDDLLFEGGAAEEGVLVTFHHDGNETTCRVVRVEEDADTGETVVELEPVDQAVQDAGGEIARANLPPDDETNTEI